MDEETHLSKSTFESVTKFPAAHGVASREVRSDYVVAAVGFVPISSSVIAACPSCLMVVGFGAGTINTGLSVRGSVPIRSDVVPVDKFCAAAWTECSAAKELINSNS
jgi:hypothetical protein